MGNCYGTEVPLAFYKKVLMKMYRPSEARENHSGFAAIRELWK